MSALTFVIVAASNQAYSTSWSATASLAEVTPQTALTLQFWGSASSQTAGRMIGVSLTLEGETMATAKLYATSASMHLPLLPAMAVVSASSLENLNLTSPSISFGLKLLDGTICDENDLFSLVITATTVS